MGHLTLTINSPSGGLTTNLFVTGGYWVLYPTSGLSTINLGMVRTEEEEFSYLEMANLDLAQRHHERNAVPDRLNIGAPPLRIQIGIIRFNRRILDISILILKIACLTSQLIVVIIVVAETPAASIVFGVLAFCFGLIQGLIEFVRTLRR